MARAYVGIGSSLGDREATVRSALQHMERLAQTWLLRCSPVYETRPIGGSEHPFLNAVAELKTALEPEALLSALLDVEQTHGRLRSERYAARTLDLDLLLYYRDGESVRVDSQTLTLPHPELWRRDFVLAPLADLDPNLAPGSDRTVKQILEALSDDERTILRTHGKPPP